MDAIKKFFDKKKVEIKFKHVGEGKKLTGEASTSRPASRKPTPMHVRSAPSGGAQLAGAAALARFEINQKKEIDWSLQAIKAQARREMEAEKKLEELQISSGDKLERNEPAPPQGVLDGPPQLAVQGVYFYCPLLGPEIATYNEIKDKIRDFLYNQIDDGKGVASCLIIHTCNKSKDKINTCVETLSKYIDNIVSNPEEEKYRKIRTSNKAYQERVAHVEGTKEFLEAAGFVQQELPFNEETHLFWVFPEEKLSSELPALEQLRDTLICAEPLKPQLDRCIQVLLPTEAAKYTDLPSEFYTLSAEELKKEMQHRASAVERSMQLRTKVMREKEEAREMRKYRFSLIRIRFPDGLILQGTFGIFEKFNSVMEFVRENLVNDWRPFFLSMSGGGKISEEDHSLLELRLAPAVMLSFEWDCSIKDSNLDDNMYLKPETLELLQPMQ